jgi:hypothetical protein
MREQRRFKSTNQKRTDLSELPDTSRLRDGTTRSVLTKSECARVDEITSLVLREFVRDSARAGPHDGGLTSVSQILMVFAEKCQRHAFHGNEQLPHLVPRASYQKFLVPRTRYPVAERQGRHWSGMTLVELDRFPRLACSSNDAYRQS